MFTLLCSDLQVKERLHFQHLAANGNSYLTAMISSFISVTRGISATSEYQTLCSFFPVVSGREIYVQTVHCNIKARNCILIIRHISCYNISFCHHYRIVFLILRDSCLFMSCLILLSCYCFLENYFHYFRSNASS